MWVRRALNGSWSFSKRVDQELTQIRQRFLAKQGYSYEILDAHSRPRLDFRCPKPPMIELVESSDGLLARQLHKRAQQHVRTVDDIGVCGELVGAMASPSRTGNKDHACGGQHGKVLGVVTCTRYECMP